MKHHFSHFLKSLTITLDKTQYPGKAGVVSWQRGKHDREPHNLFQVRRLGDKPVKAKIGMEMWHSPELYEVPEAMEKLLTLPSGEGRGLYSMAYICTALWNYGTVNTGVIGEPPDQKVQFDAPLAAAFGLSPEEAAHPVALSRLPELLKKVLSPPKPLSLEYEVDVTAGSTGKPICLDLHVEVPLSFEGTSGAPPEWLKTMRGKLDKELEAVDHAVATTVGRFREHRRRHTVLMAFSIDPVRTIEELVAAQGKELRLAVSKEAEAVEVMKLSDLFNEKWTQDAILKYLGKKQAQEAAAAVIGQQMAQAAAVVQTQWNAAIMARAAMVAGQQNQQNNNAAQAQQAAGPQQQVAAEAAPAQAQEQPAEPAAAPAAQR